MNSVADHLDRRHRVIPDIDLSVTHSFKRARVKVDDIVFDAGTQIRVAINEPVVADYAERMTEGVQFPPVVLFHDGNQRYLADGFHRFMAARRNQFRDIDAEVKPGTKQDALWFALGANKANGQRLTEADRKNAVLIAVRTFMNDKSQRQIAEQIGCSQGFVSLVISRNNVGRPERVPGADGNTYPANKDARMAIRDKAASMLRDGATVDAVRKAVGVGRETAYQIKREIGLSSGVDKSKAAVAERRERIREMAGMGYTSKQIASAIGVDERTVPVIAREEGIDIPADRAVGRIKRHDSNRIVAQIVADAENLTEGVELIDFAEVDRSQIAEWLKSLQASRDKLGGFIRRLIKEQQKHGEAA